MQPSGPSPYATPVSPMGVIWFRIAIVYLIIGITLGIVMGATQQFGMRPVHAHLNLVGWATGALAGLLYLFFPQAATSKLGKTHFVLHNLGVPVMMASLALVLSGNMTALPALIMGELATAGGVLAFAANLLVNIKATSVADDTEVARSLPRAGFRTAETTR